MTAVVIWWIAYVVIQSSFVYWDLVATWFWPACVTLAPVVVGAGLAVTQRYRSYGVGMLLGVALGVVTETVLVIIFLSALADEIGYS